MQTKKSKRTTASANPGRLQRLVRLGDEIIKHATGQLTHDDLNRLGYKSVHPRVLTPEQETSELAYSLGLLGCVVPKGEIDAATIAIIYRYLSINPNRGRTA